MNNPLRVLVLEDSPADAELGIAELRGTSFDPQWTRVETEADYLAALDTSPEVILADYSLPRFDGLSALRILRERQLDIPFILVSGMLGEEAAVDAMKHGATDFVLKDRLARLGAAVERALEEKRLRVENRESDAALRASEERLRLAMDAAQMGSWDWDLRTGEVLWSPHYERIFGYKPGTPRRSFADFQRSLHPEDAQRVEAALNEAIAKRGVYDCEFRVVWPDGSSHWVSEFGRFHLDGEGSPIRMVGMVTDITPRKEAEEALRHSEQFARGQWAETEAALEAMPANIAILDSDGTIVRVNTAWKSFCSQNGGSPETTSAGVNYLAVCESTTGPEADEAHRFAAGIHSVIHGECVRFSMEYPCHSPTEQRWFMGYVTAPRSEGTAARAVIAHVDITEQKRIEEQIRTFNFELESRVIARTAKLRAAVEALQAEIDKRKLLEREILEISEREQSRFGQDLHDGLGQELSGIALISKVLAEKLKAETHPLAETADNISTYISKSIESTRRLAKGLYPIELDRYGLLLALEDLVYQTSQRTGIHCELKQTGNAPELEESAQIHIYRIVQESIGNAIKHGNAGHIIIESAGGDGGHTFTITDDGIGFQKTADNHGMGLNLMKYRARVIGAEISVESPEEGGCRITCWLPA